MDNVQLHSPTQKIGRTCKYCGNVFEDAHQDTLECISCRECVHLNCLKRGTVPGSLVGDVFFEFTCQVCSTTGMEQFIREKMPWLQTILLVLYHMQTRSPGLARKGYFHWKIHIAAFIDRNWETLFRKDFKRKKKWTGTISGTLSHYSPYFFKSGTSIFNEQGWWTLSYPKLAPNIIVRFNTELMIEKQKLKEMKINIDDREILNKVILSKSYISEDMLNSGDSVLELNGETNKPDNYKIVQKNQTRDLKNSIKKKRFLLPTIASLSVAPSKKLKRNHIKRKKNLTSTTIKDPSKDESDRNKIETEPTEVVIKIPKFLDPLCHYNTSLENTSQVKGLTMKVRLMGGIRKEPILSPYTSIYLPPYIRRDIEIRPPWLKLMDELQSKVNRNDRNWKLPKRYPIDFTYVQPEHIPTVNSLCNQFFWTGIDLTDTLKYPDFSCVVMYKRLIVGFAFIVPDVKFNECYISFIFTRPTWRNCGIGKFMLYHLIQTSSGRDITLHVSISNPALFLYQKFGFKVECVALDFYDRYMRDDTRESKNAFFCRLER